MDIVNLKRVDFGISNYIAQAGDTLLAKKPVRIIFPLRFNQCGLAEITNEIRCTCVYAIVNEKNEYMVSNVESMMVLTPTSLSIETIDDQDYYVLSFDAGSVITPNVNLVVNDKIAYYIYKEFISRGKIPFYFSYEDLGKCLSTAHKYAGIKLSGNNATIELLASTISRSNKDLYKYYRHTISDMSQQQFNPPKFIPFTSVIYNTTSTMGKIMGGYFNEGLVSALTRDSADSVDGVETLLRQ